MTYDALYCSAQKSLNSGIHYILSDEARSPSLWSDEGIGWHEQWNSSQHAGVFASCQVLILLSKVRSSYPEILKDRDCDRLFYAIYDQNLFRLFDENYQIPFDPMAADIFMKKNFQRMRGVESTYKLAFYLTASLAVGQLVQAQKTAALLLERQDRDGVFSMVKSVGEHRSLLATALAYDAIGQLPDGKDALDKTKSYLISTLKSKKADQVTIALWALSESRELSVDDFLAAAHFVLSHQSTMDHTLFSSKYQISMGGSEIFHFNPKQMVYQAILRYIMTNITAFSSRLAELISLLNKLAPELCHMAENIQENGRMLSSDGVKSALFGENYHTLMVLWCFCRILDLNQPLREVSFMVVSPKHFNKTDFRIQNNTVAVIMPFSVTWRNAVFSAFQEALPEYHVWISDEDFGDDSIMQGVWEHINTAEFVICDCTGRNPNVFYELGIAHTLGKRVFICAQNVKDLPFDINHIRTFIYNYRQDCTSEENQSALDKLKRDLVEFVKVYSEDES
ncbi:MAG: hypothetical protein IKC63_01190 [Clostridia bacterium]|nr:hypothetical protein [Clostridia bacterium]